MKITQSLLSWRSSNDKNIQSPLRSLAWVFFLSAAAILTLLFSTVSSSFAGSATWKSNPASGDWNTATNWTPQTIPNGPSDTATFASSNTTSVSVSGPNTQVNSIVFNPGASAFTISTVPQIISNPPSPQATLLLSGVGITNNSGVTQDFSGVFLFTNSATAGSQNVFTINGPATSSEGGQGVAFSASANAGNSTFILNGATVQSTVGGAIVFFDSSTAAAATIIANGGVASGGYGGDVRFWGTSTAGNATLIANDQAGSFYGGKIEFLDHSHGGTARVEVFGAGSLHFEDRSPKAGGLTIGSIEGDGYYFPYALLVVGTNNLDTTFSGFICCGGLTKIGNGTLTLTGANAYAGSTTIKRGKLLVNNTTGSGTGNGTVQVNAGRLGGTGIIAGNVIIGDGTGRGALVSAGVNRTSTSTLTMQSGLTFNSDGTYKVQLNSTSAKADKVLVAGVVINSGAQFNFTDVGSGTLPLGTVFTIINNTGPTPIAGTFSNLPDGSTFTSNGNNFQASYTGGTGNDLILTVVP